jgi:hypothetical protein
MGENRIIDGAILLSMILLSSWIVTEFGQLNGQTQPAFVASSYGTMAIVALLIAVAAGMNFGFLSFEGINKDAKQIIPLLLVGGAAGFMLTSSGSLLLTKFVTAGAIDPTLGFLFVIVLAVFVETYFFWAAIYPSIKRFLGGRAGGTVALIGAALITSFLFATWHVVATNGDQSRLMGEFLYSLFSIALLELTGSIATPLAAHFIRNLVTAG